MFLFSGGQFSWQLGGLLSPRLKISSRVSENCYSYCKQIQIYKKVFVKQTVGLVFWLMVNLKLEFFKGADTNKSYLMLFLVLLILKICYISLLKILTISFFCSIFIGSIVLNIVYNYFSAITNTIKYYLNLEVNYNTIHMILNYFIS